MVANFNNPCLSDWGVKQPSTSLNSGVWLLRAACWSFVPAARRPLSRGNVTSGGELSAMGETQVHSAEELQLWRFAPLSLSTVWMQVWVVGVILVKCPWEIQQPPFRQEAHCMYFCGPAMIPKLFSCDPLAFWWSVLVRPQHCVFHLGSTLCSDWASFVSSLGLGKKRKRGRWVGISAFPSKFIIWPGS